MQVAKIYELIKQYPGSPQMGERVIQSISQNGSTNGYILVKSIQNCNLIKLSPSQVEDFPEFWRIAT